MKKMLVISLLCLVCFLAVGCRPAATGQLEKVESSEEDIIGPFECVAKINTPLHSSNPINNISFFRDTNTNLIYILVKNYNGNATYGGFTPYYNTEGNLMTYDEWKEIYDVD